MKFRHLSVALLLTVVVGIGFNSGLRAEAQMPAAADGFKVHFPEPWINKTTGDLSKDLARATAEGRILAVFWEQEGCHYCQQMHEVTFQIPEIVDYIKKNFYTVQLDMRGAGRIAGFDGKPMSETKLGQNFQVRGTPTTIFYTVEGGEVARMPGYAQPIVFKKVFEFVAEKGYVRHSMVDWIRARLTKEASG